MRRVWGSQSKLLGLGLILTVFGTILYMYLATPSYSVPPDPIYLAVGPNAGPDDADSVRIDELILTADLGKNLITIFVRASFPLNARPYYFDFYLPFVVTMMSTWPENDSNFTSTFVHTLDDKCSVVHAEIVKSGLRELWFYIKTAELSTAKSQSEQVFAVTFGYPQSSRFKDEIGGFSSSSDVFELTPSRSIKVTVGASPGFFFSSETYPEPDVEFIGENERYATWVIAFSGELHNYYRSIHCITTSPTGVALRGALLAFSIVVISLGANALLHVVEHRFLSLTANGSKPDRANTVKDAAIIPVAKGLESDRATASEVREKDNVVGDFEVTIDEADGKIVNWKLSPRKPSR